LAAKAEQVSRARGFILKERLVLRVFTIIFHAIELQNGKRRIFCISLKF
jgi:hypothetical protein